MRFVISIIVFFIIAFLAVLFLSVVLPSDYENTERQSFAVPVEEAWNFISRVKGYPKFREEYYYVQVLSKRKNHVYQWQAYMSDGKLAVYQINNFMPQKHLSIELIRCNNKMTGNWDFYFFGDTTNCTIEITENSTMDDPIEKVIWYLTNRNSRINREFELIEGLEE
ncbi:MAG: hypothetical protein U9R19_06120 [Bacteroidota bacterium]|nr:hypothetical protein [Bacteroidota bacterium]